jgi:hypothetical protein
MTTLLGHRVVGIITRVEPCAQLGRGDNFISLVESGHLGFRTSFVGVGLFGCFATVEK